MIREPHPIDAILPTMEGIRTIVEVGCHRMEDTAFLRQTFPAARIIAFEPDPRNARLIVDQELDWRHEVDFFELALGDTDEVRDFYLSTNHAVDPRDEWTRSSSLRPPRKDALPDVNLLRQGVIPCVVAEHPARVACVRLDTFVADVGLKEPADFIWCDAQGADDLVLIGAVETLKRTKYLFVEHNSNGCYQDGATLETIRALLPGWDLLHCWPYDALFVNPHA